MAYYTVGEPQYADLDADNDLDAAIEIAAYAGGGTPSLFVWLWEDGEAVQAKYPAAIGFDCGDTISNFSGADHALIVEMMTGAWCGEGTSQPETFTVEVIDGYPMQTAPAVGSVSRCSPQMYPPFGTGTGTALVAPFPDAPQITGEFTDIQLLDASSIAPPGWNLARMTGADGSAVCGWIAA